MSETKTKYAIYLYPSQMEEIKSLMEQANAKSQSEFVSDLHSKEGAYTENRQQITQEEEAQNILDSYTRVKFRWLPLKRFGEPPVRMDYSDPYAQYIAEALVR